MIYELVSFGITEDKEKKLKEYFKYTKVKYINQKKEKDFLKYIERHDNLIILVNNNLNIKYYKILLEQKKKKTVMYIYIKSQSKHLMYSLGADLIIDADFDELELYRLFILSCDSLNSKAKYPVHPYIHGNKQLYINLKTLDCFSDSQKISLTKSEYKILFSLIDAQNKVVSREELLSLISVDNNKERIIDGIIKNLRKKIGKNKICSIHNVGYALQK